MAYALSLLIHLSAWGAIWSVSQQLAELSLQVERGKSSIQLVAVQATPNAESPTEVTIEAPLEPLPPPQTPEDIQAAEIEVERSEPPPAPVERGEVAVMHAPSEPSTETTLKRTNPSPQTPPEPKESKPRPTRKPAKREVAVDTTVPMNSVQSSGSLWDVPPKAMPTNRAPSYPAAAVAARQQGKVVLLVEIHADGSVGSVTVSASSGFRDLDVSAGDAVRNWRFSAARRGNTMVACEVLVPIIFQLR